MDIAVIRPRQFGDLHRYFDKDKVSASNSSTNAKAAATAQTQTLAVIYI